MALELSKGCICLLCGIPGSGKSHFIGSIKHNFKDQNLFSAYFVQFDEIIPIEKQLHSLNEEKGFKRSRQSFINCCRLFLSYLIYGEKAIQISDEESQRRVELILKLNNNVDKRRFVLFVEDNFYLRSMRYEFVKLAKHFSLGFVQLILNTSLQLCLSRNECRVNQVPEAFIIKMKDVFENPNSEKYKWEINSLLLQGIDSEIENICVLIKESMKNPFREVFDEKEQRLNNQRINNDNLMHRFDCFLRQIIGEEIKEREACERRQIAQQLTKRKAQLLRESQDLPEWFVNELLGKNGFENINCKLFAKKLLNTRN